MHARAAYLVLLVFGCLIVLYSVAHALYLKWPLNSLPVHVLSGIGGYLIIVNYWAYLRDDGSPRPPVAAATHATVLGFVILLVLVSLRLHGQVLPPALLTLLPTLGLVLLVLGILLSTSRPATVAASAEFSPQELAELGISAPYRRQTARDPRADRYGMAPLGAYTLFMVLGFLLILYAITHTLQFSSHDRTLIYVLVGMGLFIMSLALWLYHKTGIVKVIRPYRHLGFATFLCVLGFLLILFMQTLLLMQLPIEIFQQRAAFIGGLILIALGLLLNRSGKQLIRISRY